MSVFSEVMSFFSSFDPGMMLAWTAGAVALPLAAVFGDDEPKFDEEGIRTRIAELEKIRTRTIEQQEELAESYVMLAIALYEEEAELDEILELYSKAENVLQQTLSQGEDDEIRRKLGTVFLHRAVTFNDYDDLEKAVQCYDQAIEAMLPLDNKGDGEAKYDIAGIKLNRGMIFHETGEYEKAEKDFDDAFLAFRAVEKISDLDTRFYMAKVSVAQGSLLRDLDRPLDKIVDAYNRAMRLYVELIDMGQLEHERELANVLMDRCTAYYEAYLNQEFESAAERKQKFDAVLLDVTRAIEILDRLAAGGDLAARIDLFNAYATQGAMLLDIEAFTESQAVFKQVIAGFADFAKDADPTLVSQYAAAFENSGFASMNLNCFDEALAEFNKAIELREKIQSEDFDLDDEERMIFVPSLATSYANRANAFASLNNLDAARTDCSKGIQLLQPLKDDGDEEIEEIESMLKALLENWS